MLKIGSLTFGQIVRNNEHTFRNLRTIQEKEKWVNFTINMILKGKNSKSCKQPPQTVKHKSILKLYLYLLFH